MPATAHPLRCPTQVKPPRRSPGKNLLSSYSEDMYTGINLANVGYGLRYAATVVTKGVCPDSFNGFITQQYRWCAGSMSLMLSRQFRAMNMPLPPRACYWAGFLYYITTALDVLTIAIP